MKRIINWFRKRMWKNLTDEQKLNRIAMMRAVHGR